MRLSHPALAAIFLCGCPSGPTLDVFCQGYVDRVTERLQLCNGSTVDAWAAVLDKDHFCAEVAASEDAGRTKYHPEYAESCFKVVTNTPCELLAPGKVGGGELDILCSETVNGLLAEGADCFASRECGLDFHCDQAAGRCPGKCIRLRTFNEICDENGHTCANGFICVSQGQTSGCMVAMGDGGSCTDSSVCGGGLFCDPSTSPMVCAPTRSEGSCMADTSACSQAAVCTADKVCAVAKQEGDPCTPGKKECNLLAYCSASGFCARWGARGEACGALVAGENADCLEGGCVLTGGSNVGTCDRFDAGDSCMQKEQCGRGGLCAGTETSTAPVCHPRCAPAVP